MITLAPFARTVRRSAWLGVGFSLAAAAGLPADAATLLVEAEAFQFRGGWNEEESSQVSGTRSLWTMAGGAGEAITVVQLPEAGQYQLWTRARDYAQREPGTRLFQLVVNGQPAKKQSGAHGKDGWYWERVGTQQLPAGKQVLALRDTAKFFGRCDAVILTTDASFDPNTQDLKSLAQFRVPPTIVEAQADVAFPKLPAASAAADAAPSATLQNDTLRVRFVPAKEQGGKTQLRRVLEVRVGGQWVVAPGDGADETLFVLFSDKGKAQTGNWFPGWSSSVNALKFQIEGKEHRAAGDQANPFFAATPVLMVPRTVTQVDNRTVRVGYESADGLRGEAAWSIAEAGGELRCEFRMKADKAGNYSVGFKAFQPYDRQGVEQVLLPPLFNYLRLPDQPVMVTSSMTPHPIALVQVKPQGVSGSMSLAVVADPAALPYEWAKPGNARYGFSLLDEAGKVQPTLFTPVLGMPGSKLAAGQELEATWRVLAVPGEWTEALRYSSERIFNVTDYRRPVHASLTDAAQNMIALMMADNKSWSDRHKGYWNIEGHATVTQAAPLTMLSAAVLAQDEELYAQRALPTIEYTLSRPQSHFATDPPEEARSWVKSDTLQVKFLNDFYGAGYWQGVDALLGHANPWIGEIAAQLAENPKPSGNFIPAWTELLPMYRADPRPELLAHIKREADAWLEKDLYGRHNRELGLAPFYNHGMYPYWWDLVDLYEATGEKRYLDAAWNGAYRTLAGLWAQPLPPEGDITLHPGNKFDGQNHMWYRGDERFRLGFPRKPGDAPEHQAPAWLVSRVGLSLEQPTTYFGGGEKGFSNIMMAAWTPHLLRVYEHTGDPLVLSFARNGIIGRFANYPGYYINGHTDLQMTERYPYDGPDVTNIYYHHVPPHLAFTLDWLFTEAQVRSGGRVAFPYVKQHRYVWFNSRAYGHAPGNVFGDTTALPRLNPKLVDVDGVEINHLLARGKDAWWVILMSDVNEPVTASVRIDAARGGIKTGSTYRVVDAQGQDIGAGTVSPVVKQDVPARGLVALRLPAETAEPVKSRGLGLGRLEREIGGPWGTLYAFRIRGPFGKDSLYTFVTGRPKGGQATLELESDPQGTHVDGDYPYEFTVYPWPMEQDLRFTLTLRDASGAAVQTERITLPGTPE